MYLKTFMVLTT